MLPKIFSSIKILHKSTQRPNNLLSIPFKRRFTQSTSNPPWSSWNSWNTTSYIYPIPSKVKIIEVGCRDGIQNESNDYIVPVDSKFNLLSKLSETGITNMEGGAFVHPKWVPQMATSDEVFSLINGNLKTNAANKSITYSGLVPNTTGLKKAMNFDINEVIMITAASEEFAKKNMNCTIAESLKRCDDVIKMAHEKNIRVRTAISCCLGCPYEGSIDRQLVCDIVEQLDDMDCDEIAIADTIGIGTPGLTYKLMNDVKERMEVQKGKKGFIGDKIAGHYHNTYGQALNNILTSLAFGVSTFDCSVAGLGGCPYAKGLFVYSFCAVVVFLCKDIDVSVLFCFYLVLNGKQVRQEMFPLKMLFICYTHWELTLGLI